MFLGTLPVYWKYSLSYLKTYIPFRSILYFLHASDTSPCYSTWFVDWKIWHSDISFPSLQWPVFFPIPETLFLPFWCVAWQSELWFFWFHKVFLYGRTLKQCFCLQYLRMNVLLEWMLFRIVMRVDREVCGSNGNLRWPRNLDVKMLRERNGAHALSCYWVISSKERIAISLQCSVSLLKFWLYYEFLSFLWATIWLKTLAAMK